jgi:LytS/YehU family sensor histidine kinase
MSLIMVVGRLAAAVVVLSVILGGLIAIIVHAYLRQQETYAERARKSGL